MDMAENIFRTSEYIKGWLAAPYRSLGKSPWSHRMLEMLYDLEE